MDWQRILRSRDNIASVAELTDAGLSRHVLANRLRTGRWQRVLPGIVAAQSGPLALTQRRAAALSYGGRGAVLSHRSAAVLLGLRVEEGSVEITTRHGHSRRSSEFVVVHQSLRPITRTIRAGQPCTSAARTVVDTSCAMSRLDDVRALVCDAVQRRLTTIAAIDREAERAPRSAPRNLRLALEEVKGGARSQGEAAFLRLVRRARLPDPELNATVRVAGRKFVVDALWREYGVAVEIDGMAWHLGATAWERDLRRQNLIHISGLTVLRFPVRRIRDDPDGVIAEIWAAIQTRASAS